MTPSESLRYQTLTRLEAVLRLLVERHGARMTLGEMLAITAAMARLCRQDRVTIAEIAEATGISKQNLSRWAHKRIGDSIILRVNEEDRREHDVIILDPQSWQRAHRAAGPDHEDRAGRSDGLIRSPAPGRFPIALVRVSAAPVAEFERRWRDQP